MRYSEAWTDYELLDCSDGERLERWGEIILVRPDPQVIWKTKKTHPLWNTPHARYNRSNKGGGAWSFYSNVPESWHIKYRNLTFLVRPTGFKHTGLFPEQAVNWDFFTEVIQSSKRPLKVLNLFAYTGGATAACVKAGAHTVHVDAAKGMVSWARENSVLSETPNDLTRWIVDDCAKFVKKEMRRGNIYDIIIMDPPSYGRGPGGEIWKLENEIYSLISDCAALLSGKSLLFAVNSYTTGLSPGAIEYMLNTAVTACFGGAVRAEEIGIPVTATGNILPCGATSFWLSDNNAYLQSSWSSK